MFQCCFFGLIGGILGEDFNYAGGDGNYYSGNTGWHPDGSWGQLFAAKTAFYLDPLTRTQVQFAGFPAVIDRIILFARSK